MMESAHSAEARYHRIGFEKMMEAAAFVAALSRFLASPAGHPYRESALPAEVRGRPWSTDGFELYLSERALAAAATVFSPVPVTEICPRGALPSGCVLVLDAAVSAWGLGEAQEHLSALCDAPAAKTARPDAT